MNDDEKLLSGTLFGYRLTPHQNIWINHLIPGISSFFLYSFLLASDLVVVYRHYYDDNPIWASLTIFLLYAPVLGSFIVTISTLELWPNPNGYGVDNIKWFIIKFVQHLCFPLWSIWRYAERLFWSIEALRTDNDEEILEAIKIIISPRSVELYLFLQAFLQSLPQILFQIHLLMLTSTTSEKQTADAQVLSIVFNLSKLSAITAFYQRFKTQKLAGKQYPWYKSYKQQYNPTIDNVVLRNNQHLQRNSITERRRSSDFYLEPAQVEIDRQSSIIAGAQIQLNNNSVQPDFNIQRLIYIRGLPDDDLAGKLVAFLWWSCFILTRILAIASFTYFYHKQVLWFLIVHFVLVEMCLIYDAKTDHVQRAKAVFFLFLGLIYLFVLIEFKIKFKKTKFIYYGFFTLVYLENFIMCLIWWFSDIELLENDFWFRYVFCVIVMSSIISLTAMLFYLNVNKPKKIVVGTRVA